jgi:prepilin peptidase CpaA
MMSAPHFAVAVPLLAILAVATLSDVRTRRIPNGLSIGGAALGLLVNAFTFGPSGLALAAIGCALCLGCFMPLYVSGGTAAGDVKLMAMVGSFLGPVNGFLACLLALVAGASIATVCLAWRNHVAPRLRTAGSSADQPLESAPFGGHALDKIPYATAIALGTAVAVLQPSWLAAFLPLGATQ